MKDSIAKQVWIEIKKSMNFRESLKTYFEPFVLIYLWIVGRIDVSEMAKRK